MHGRRVLLKKKQHICLLAFRSPFQLNSKDPEYSTVVETVSGCRIHHWLFGSETSLAFRWKGQDMARWLLLRDFGTIYGLVKKEATPKCIGSSSSWNVFNFLGRFSTVYRYTPFQTCLCPWLVGCLVPHLGWFKLQAQYQTTHPKCWWSIFCFWCLDFIYFFPSEL
jgi:hypothetical protein